MDNSDVKDILDIERGPATPQLSKESIMGTLKVYQRGIRAWTNFPAYLAAASLEPGSFNLPGSRLSCCLIDSWTRYNS